MSKSKSKPPETNWTFTTSTHTGMEVGRDWDGFYYWSAQDTKGI